MRKKNYYHYKDAGVLYDEHKTTVVGQCVSNKNVLDDLTILQNQVINTYYLLNDKYIAMASSQCLEEDTYSKKKGMIIASRKAEIKAFKKALKDVTLLRRALEQELELVKDMEDKLDLKVIKLALDLVRINRE